MPRKAIVIHSPYSGKSEQLQSALIHLRESGVEIVDVIPVAALDHLPAQGTRWRQDGIELAVAAGGDGLIGGVITHIAENGLMLGIATGADPRDVTLDGEVRGQTPMYVHVASEQLKVMGPAQERRK